MACVPFLLLGIWICNLIIGDEPKRGMKQKPKYRMKEVDNEGEIFFTDATDFDEAFKL